MDFERVRNFSNERAELKDRMETAEPLSVQEALSPAEQFVDLVARIEALPGFDPTGRFGIGTYGTWKHIIEPDETHPLPLELSFSVSYDGEGQANLLHATWHDNLNHFNSMSALPISHEWVSRGLDPGLITEESARMIGLISESVAAAEELVARSVRSEQG
jgi:hypothetical protein